MSQPQLVVPRRVIDALVDDFLASGKRYCTSFRPDALRDALRVLPGGDSVNFHLASRTLGRFECTKMTGGCNTWTPWMRHRLNANKRAI